MLCGVNKDDNDDDTESVIYLFTTFFQKKTYVKRKKSVTLPRLLPFCVNTNHN